MQVFIVCYSISSPTSLRNTKEKCVVHTHLFICTTKRQNPHPISMLRWVPELRHHCPDVPIILVGNKLDLRADERCLQKLAVKGEQLVTDADAQAIGAEVGAEMVLACSAKTREGLTELFHNAVRVASQGHWNLGYKRTSLMSKTCQRCRQPSKASCECERKILQVCGSRRHTRSRRYVRTCAPMLAEARYSTCTGDRSAMV